MQQLQTVAEIFRLQHFRRGKQFHGAQTELGILAAALGPFARAFAQQPRADADERFHTERFGNRDDVLQLFQLFDDHDDAFAELDAEQRHLDELRVLVAVADDESALLVLQRKAGEEFRLAADFQAEVVRLAGIENFLHDFAELVHLDGKHAAILALKIKFRDGALKRLVNRLNAMPQNILKANEQWKFQPATFGFFNDVRDVHARARVLQGFGDDVAGVVDVKILRAPALDVVEVARGINVPRRVVIRIAHLKFFLNERTIKIPAQNAIITLKKFSDVGGVKFISNLSKSSRRAATRGNSRHQRRADIGNP